MFTELTIFAGMISLLQAECSQTIINFESLKQNNQSISNELLINQEMSFSFWFKYEPRLKIQTQQFLASTTIVGLITSGQLLFRVYDKEAKLYRIYSYFDINNHNLKTMIINVNENILSNEVFNQNFLEGIWQYKLYKIEPINKKIDHFVYNYVTQTLNINQNDFVIDQTTIQLSIGGFGYFSDYQQSFYFNQFPGLISSLNIHQGSLDIASPQFKSELTNCIQAQLKCNPIKQTLISDIQISPSSIFKSNFLLDTTFQIQAWFKLSINKNNKIYNLLQVRDENITTFNIIDERNLLFDLTYVILDGEFDILIQLKAQTYEQFLYYSKAELIKITSTVILVSQWHFITIMYDREQISQTGIDIYFPFTNQFISERYSNLILFFTGLDLYFYIGSNNKLLQYYSGELGEVLIQSCIQRPYTYQLKCDRTCKTCNGPTQNFCTECEPTDNRQLKQNKCLCNENYFQFSFQNKCSQLKQNNFFLIEEIKYNHIQCQYGQFIIDYNGQQYCIDCPFSQIENSLYCGDCIENQQFWQFNQKCTYNYELSDPFDEQSTFIKVKQDIQLYIVDLNSLSINNCIGCLEICNDDDCQIYKYTNFGQLIKIRCKPNYYFKNGECLQCDQFCSKCSNNVCLQCLPNYYFNSILQLCLLDSKQKQQCGYKCVKCVYKANQNRCLKCTNNYKISDDGYNCESFEIPNCLNEYNKNGIKSTIPYLFDPLTEIITQPFCSHCSTNNYNQVNQQCTTEINPTCTYSINQNTCLIGQDSTILKTDCNDHCLLCFQDLIDFVIAFCVQCKDGYYIDLFSGTCMACPSNCKNCALNQLIGNSDRILITLITFYQQGVLKQYLNSLFQIFQEIFELICLDCYDGYLLKNGICINECPSNCDNCQIINNQNICIKCTTITQKIQSDNCFECPPGCLACSKRTQEEIYQINSLFDLSISTFQKYSHKCYKPLENNTKMSNQVALNCQIFQNCQKGFSIQIQAFCLKDQFEQLSQNADEDFFINNFYLGDLMAQFELNFLNQQFLEQLNYYLIQEISFSIKLISNSGECSFNDETFLLNQKFIKYIFNLQSVRIKFFSDNLLSLQLPNLWQLQNYTKIVFQNIIFYGNNKVHIIDAFSYYNSFQIHIIDCQYRTLDNNQQENNALQFKIQSVQAIIISNFKIIKVRFFKYGLFNFEVTSSAFILEVNQLKILDSVISSLNLFEIKNPQNLNFNIKLKNIDINAKFINSSIMSINTSSINNGEFNLEQFNLIDSSIFGLNYLLILRTQITNLVDCILKGNAFYNETSFMYSEGFNLQNIKITNNLIHFGKFFTNYDQNNPQFSLDQVLVWKQVIFQQIYYSNYNQFISLQNNSKLQIIIDDFQIIENLANKDIIKENDYQKSLVYLYGNKLSMKNLNIIKQRGIIELFLQFNSIEITKCVLKQKEGSQILIQPSQTCLSNQENILLYTPLIDIGNSQIVMIDSLQILGLSVVNGYVIGIEENDGISIKTTIQNSQFLDNNILIEQTEVNSGIIKFVSKSESIINIKNCEAMNNILYSYNSDINSMLGTVLMISNLYGSIEFNDNRFINNHAINTRYSITYFYGQKISVKNNYYKNNNLNELKLIQSKISDSFSDEVFKEQIQEIYQRISNGGNGFYFGDNIVIQDCIFNSSTALFGGGIYIQTLNQGNININNCQFINLKTDLSENLEGKGGGLFIDGSYAGIQLKLIDCQFENTMAKVYGGVIYIEASKKQNKIIIKNLKMKNVISIMASFIYVSFNDLDISNLHIDNIVWTIDYTVIKQYFGELRGFKKVYGQYIKERGMLIFTQNGNIKLENFRIYSNYYFGFISLKQCLRCTVHNILIYQPKSMYYNSFYFGNNNQFENSYIIMNEIFIDTLTAYPYTSTTQCKSAINLKVQSAHLQCNQKQFQKRDIESFITDTQFQDNADCNLNLLLELSNSQYGVSLMDIFQGYYLNGNQMSQVQQIKSITILSSSYDFLDFTFQLTVYGNPKKNKTLLISDVLSIENTGFEFLRIQVNSEIQRLLQQTSQTINLYSVYIENFINHLGYFQMYSGLVTENYQALINNFIITNNTQAQSNIIHSNLPQKVYQFYINCLVTDNILISKTISNPLRLSFTPITPELYRSNSIFLFNYRQDYSELTNIAEFHAKRLKLKYDGIKYLKSVEKIKNDTMIIDEIYVKPYKAPGLKNLTKYLMLPSGQRFQNYSYFDKTTETFIPLNINMSITLINTQDEKMNLYSGTIYNLNAKYRIINESNPQENQNFTDLLQISVTDVELNEVFLNDLIVEFDPYTDPALYYQLAFTCNLVEILSYQDTFPYMYKDSINNYELRINIRTFKCQVGEYIYLNQCRQCDGTQNYFQVLEEQSFCYFMDEVSTIQVKRYTLQIKPKFWRYRFNSTKIEYCYHQTSNCLGGWKYGDPTCIQGHIGALCEQCDLYNTRGDGSYSISSKYNCGSCDDVKWNIAIIVIIACFTLILGAITVKSNYDDTSEFILLTKVKGSFGISTNVKIMTTILIKLFTNYAQIISSIFTFQLTLPPEIQQSTNGIGNPTQSMVYSLDCFLISISEMKIIQMEFIWMLSTPFFFIFIIYFFFLILILINFTKFNLGVISTTLIYFYIYMQPNLIQNMTSQLSRRSISDEEFVQGNVAYLYQTKSHQNWLAIVIIPILIIIGVIIPFTLWYNVYKNKKNLLDIKVRQTWGFLYNEYKIKAYYWETIKLLQKQTIIIGINYYEDYVSIKASLILLIVFIYHVLSNKYKPYYAYKLNRLDTYCTVVCSISIILCSAIYAAQIGGQDEIVWPFYIITITINILYILDLFIHILFSYLQQHHDRFDKVKTFITKSCPYLIDKFPNLKKLLITKQQKQNKIKERWAKVKELLLRKAQRTLKAKRYTFIHSPESYYQKRLGINSPSPINSYRCDAIKDNMIDSQSQLNSFTQRKQNICNTNIKVVEPEYQQQNEEDINEPQTQRDEFQVVEDPLSPQIVYLSFNPKSMSQFRE